MPAAPHPPLTGYYGSPEMRPAYLRALFDRTARDYDRINALMSLGWGRRYRREMLAAAGLRPGMRHARRRHRHRPGRRPRPGGSLTAGAAVVGLDASRGMLAEAQRAGAADLLVLGASTPCRSPTAASTSSASATRSATSPISTRLPRACAASWPRAGRCCCSS